MTAPYVITLSGEIDMATVHELEAGLLAGIDTARAALVVVDLDGVTFIDSVGLGLLRSIYKRQHARGARVALMGASSSLVELLHLTGMNELLSMLDQIPASPPVSVATVAGGDSATTTSSA